MNQTYLRYEEAFKKGLAVGGHDIKNDLVHFEFCDKDGEFERFSFPTFEVVGKVAKFNGIYYEAKVKDLRRLKDGLRN